MTHRLALLTSMGAWALLFAAPVVSHADILFSNFGPSFSYNTVVGNTIGNGFDGNNYAQGATFTPTTSAKFTSLDIALSKAFSTTDTLTVSLDKSISDAPDGVVESFTVSAGTLGTLGNNNPPLVLTSVLQPMLTAGTQYWVTVSDATGADSNVWNWNSTGDSSDEAISADGGANWFSPSGLTPGAYEVDGTPIVGPVPEPGALVLLATVLLLLSIGRSGALFQNR